MKILFKYPTRERQSWFRSTIEHYYNNLNGTPFEFVVVMDRDDTTMNNSDVSNYLSFFPHLSCVLGDHKTKIEACNADIGNREWDILVLVSDDMVPVAEDFDKIIVEQMKKHFPDTDGVLHFNDGFEGDKRNITLSIIGRKYYDQFGYVYHQDYKSFFCDAEFTDVAYQSGKVVYIDRVIIEHQWCGGPQSHDALYRRNSAMGKPDRKTYKRRKAAGFPK